MKPLIPLKGGDEVDAFSRRARRILRFSAGVRKMLKRKFWKRFRHEAKAYVTTDQD